MDTASLADIIAHKVINETSVWVALIGLTGVLVGAMATAFKEMAVLWFQGRGQKRLDATRMKLLRSMLNDGRFSERWRRLGTLARVIGADEETAKRLLIEIGARGSEKDDDLWGLILHHPLDNTDQ